MLIDKNTLPLVEMEFMNDTHFEDADLINEIYENIETYEKDNSQTNFENLKTKYNNWVEHTIVHFKTEEDEMQAKGFFAFPYHKNEHDINLNEIKQVWANFEKEKNVEKLKNYIEYDLVNWLVNHIKSMDTVTAKFFKTGMSPCGTM